MKIQTNIRCQIFLRAEISLWEIYLTVIKALEYWYICTRIFMCQRKIEINLTITHRKTMKHTI